MNYEKKLFPISMTGQFHSVYMFALLPQIKIISFVLSLVNGQINLGMGGQYCWESTSTGNK